MWQARLYELTFDDAEIGGVKVHRYVTGRALFALLTLLRFPTERQPCSSP